MLGSTAISAAWHTGNMLRLAAEQIVHAACTPGVAAASATRVFTDSMNAPLQTADEQRACSCVTQCVLCQSNNLTTLWRKGTNGPVFYYSLKKACASQVGIKCCADCDTEHDLQGYSPGTRWLEEKELCHLLAAQGMPYLAHALNMIPAETHCSVRMLPCIVAPARVAVRNTASTAALDGATIQMQAANATCCQASYNTIRDSCPLRTQWCITHCSATLKPAAISHLNNL